MKLKSAVRFAAIASAFVFSAIGAQAAYEPMYFGNLFVPASGTVTNGPNSGSFTAPVTNVQWNYTTSKAVRLQICHDNNCVNVSGTSGSTPFFNGQSTLGNWSLKFSGGPANLGLQTLTVYRP